MPKFKVSKSVLVKASPEKIFGIVSDFRQWTIWSPWLVMDPDAKVSVAEDNKSYDWEGRRVGSGGMKITAEEPGRFVDYDLQFLKPWKSFARVRFDMVARGEETEVTWHMDSSLPWFMFWMTKMTIAFISMDYERGLNMLKEYAEEGTVHSQLDFKGENTYPGHQFIGIKTDCTFDDIGKCMERDFTKLMTFLGDKQELICAEPISIYHKWDITGRKVSYTSGVPVSSIPGDMPDGVFAGSIPELKVYTLRHTGPYHYLGNAWGTLYNMARGKEFKQSKAHDPFEVYVNDPMQVAMNELVSEINFPVK